MRQPRREKWPGMERGNRLIREGCDEESGAQIKKVGKTGLNKDKGKKYNLSHFVNV